MKKLLFLLFAICISFTTSAQLANETEAKNYAREIISHHPAYKHINFRNLRLKTDVIREANENLIYIVNVSDNQGWMLLSAKSNTWPLLGYNNSGNFDTISMPVSLENMLINYANQNKHPGDHMDQKINEYWDFPVSLLEDQKFDQRSVSPLLSTTWSQECFYNEMCPYDINGPCLHTPTGCIATSMAQIMRFHSYPVSGSGSHSYNHSKYGQLSANFGNTTYNWNNMPDTLSFACSQAEKDAVAQLMYHCGISVNMNYDAAGSGANTADAATALRNYFSYAVSTQYLVKTIYSDAHWEQIIKYELDNSRPIIYAGAPIGGGAGHAFILDGYQGTNYFHIDWGWAGSSNGYFYLSNLTPGTSNFNSGQEMIIGIEPPQGSCSGTNMMYANTGTFDDGSGDANYINNADCKWLIQPGVNNPISIDFSKMDLENGVDFVKVYDGATTSANLLGSLSGNNIPSTLYSTGGSVLVHFTSNGSGNAGGWELIYSNNPPTYCSGLTTLTAASGAISDGSGPYNYLDNADCKWSINVSGASYIQLDFSEFKLEQGGDFLKVYDGNNTSSPLLGTFSGSNLPSQLISSGNTMLIYFTSNYQTSYEGWEATYTSDVAGLDEQKLAAEISVFPNPNNGRFTLQMENTFTGKLVIEVTDINGRIIDQRLENKTQELFVTDLAYPQLEKGLYFVKITFEMFSEYKHFIVN